MSPAELIFVGGPIITVDPRYPNPQAVAVADGRITAVGAIDEVMPLRVPDTRIVGLGGRCLLPGFIDAHAHPTQDQLLFIEAVVDIRPVTCATAEAVHAVIHAALASKPDGQPLVFNGLDVLLQKGFPEPTRAWLDELGPDRPIMVWQNSGHLAWANSAALAFAGIDDNTYDPVGGHFDRDEDGHLTGKAFETAAILMILGPIVIPELSTPGPLALEHTYLASRGVTMVSDMGFSDAMRPLTQAVYDQGLAKVRTRAYEMSDRRLHTDCPVENGDDMFRQIGIKIWVDGSPWVGNIHTSFPYLNTPETAAMGLGPDHRGHANYTSDQLHELLGAYFPPGWQLACHVHGDLGVDTILDVYEKALAAYPRVDHRLRLEHCGTMTAEQYRRAARIGVTCSLFIDHLYYWGDVLVDGLFGEDHGAHWVRAKSALDAGMPISFHNDSPVTPEEPLRNMAVAMSRMSRSGRVFAPEERITFDQALRAQTLDAAYQLFADDITGSISPGKYADLVVLETDPRTVEVAALPDIPVHSTYLSGIQTYSGVAK
ncbi:amidohydrolase [Nocardia sp. NPDC051030]|uniref:amidohydrolase n=1 Tax=Nocardia sp. NPDC051030 TaxID=3155162 RepID=UPI00341C6470